MEEWMEEKIFLLLESFMLTTENNVYNTFTPIWIDPLATILFNHRSRNITTYVYVAGSHIWRCLSSIVCCPAIPLHVSITSLSISIKSVYKNMMEYHFMDAIFSFWAYCLHFMVKRTLKWILIHIKEWLKFPTFHYAIGSTLSKN